MSLIDFLSTIDFGFFELLLGLAFGLVPSILNAIRDKEQWKDKKGVVQSEAIENIVQAAGVLAENSQDLAEKNTTIIQLYDSALDMVKEERDEERNIRMQYQEEITTLREQITDINNKVVECSREISQIVQILNEGKQVPKEKLNRLEQLWNTDSPKNSMV